MLKPMRKIPKVTAAALVVGGCGGGGGSSVDRLAREVCSDLLQCDPTYFNTYYSSLSECEFYISGYIQDDLDYYAALYGAACASAMLDYGQCYFAQYEAPECGYYSPYFACLDEYYDVYDFCY